MSATIRKDDLWARIEGRYPGGADLTAAGLRKLFDTVWDAAHAKGVENGRALEAMERDEARRSGAAASIFRDVFGRP